MLNLVLSIENQGVLYHPVLEGEISVEWERDGAPGKLCFCVVNDGKIDFHEGNPVRFLVDGFPFFYGYVFTKKRDKRQLIQVVCYDQLRYLKNKGSLRYQNWTAGRLLRHLADEYGLLCGEIADTGVLLSRREDKSSLFDMLGRALDETWKASGQRFVLYDDFGRLVLKNTQNMRLNHLIAEDTAENFSYESSIDGQTYNSVRLYYKNARRGILQEHIQKDEQNIQRWGLLQLYERVDSPDLLEQQARNLLDAYNVKRRRLKITGAFGDAGVRAGCLLPVHLVLGDVNAGSYLMVERVRHSFAMGQHRMDLALHGGWFV